MPSAPSAGRPASRPSPSSWPWGAACRRIGLAAGFLALWTIYAFVSGIVPVPYNDIVGRSIPSGSRSRLLAWRFFGGGILAVGVAVLADRLLGSQPILDAYAAIFALGAVLMLASSISFVSAGESPIRNLPQHRWRGPPIHAARPTGTAACC